MRGFLLGSLAALSIPYSSAHPSARKQSGLAKRLVDLDLFRLQVSSEYVNATSVEENPPVTLKKRASAQDIATELVKKTVSGANFRLVESYTGDNGVTHVYFRQTANDLDIDNADFNVNVGSDGNVFSFGNSFYEGKIPASSKIARRDRVDPARAFKGAVKNLGLPVTSDKATSQSKDEKETYTIKNTSGAVKEPEAKLVYLQKAKGELVLTWRVETDVVDNWLLSYVDANDGEKIHGVVDYVADADDKHGNTKHATYEVYPWGVNDPTEGKRQQLKDPWISSASEFGWHSDGSQTFLTTEGNNAIAQTNWNNTADFLNNPRPYPGSLDFSKYKYSTEDPDWHGYANASVAQLFYTANTYHDLLHVLGFNEAAGNFELNNNGAGGLGNDFAILNAQDGSGMNNANFATPPDGESGRMRMYMWNLATPWRDCSFEAGVVIHEYTHGVSNRLTGGPANVRCLSLLEAGGMGEGWGDFMATAIRLKPQDKRTTDYAMGAWVSNSPKGIRTYVYSTNLVTNPHLYSDVDAITKVHGIGTVWATILYEVLWNLIDKHGKHGSEFPKFDRRGVPTDGKHLTMKLVIDAMALQPCNPTFVSARDAILDADKALTRGENQCEIWKGFAKRGLGVGAVYDAVKRTTSFVVPAKCGRH